MKIMVSLYSPSLVSLGLSAVGGVIVSLIPSSCLGIWRSS